MMGLTQLDFENQTKIEGAIALLKVYEPPEGYYLAFSGGKDSVVIYDLAVKSGVKFDAHYCVSPIDPPQIWKFIKEYYPDVIWDYHARGFWKLVQSEGLPFRQARWCCRVIKEAGGDGRLCITGVRHAESAKRKTRRCYEQDRKKPDRRFLNPIITWSHKEVWEYIHTNNLPYCELYDFGFKRVGCVLCPFNSNIELQKQYCPEIVRLWLKACDRLVERNKKQGWINKRGKPIKHQFETGRELFDWWTARNVKQSKADDYEGYLL